MPATSTKAIFRGVEEIKLGVNMLATEVMVVMRGESKFSYLICPQNTFFHEASQII